jgi:hypothetical protein
VAEPDGGAAAGFDDVLADGGAGGGGAVRGERFDASIAFEVRRLGFSCEGEPSK